MFWVPNGWSSCLLCKASTEKYDYRQKAALFIYGKCIKMPYYGDEGCKAVFCSSHHFQGMINVVDKRCRYDKCTTLPGFGYERHKPMYCDIHRLNGMINVVNPLCKTQGCGTIARNKRYRGYCLHCFMCTFPNEKIVHNYKIKENEVLNFIVEKFSSCTVLRDRRIQDGCSARRPDVHIDLGPQVLII